jgi:mgtE-like transporter
MKNSHRPSSASRALHMVMNELKRTSTTIHSIQRPRIFFKTFRQSALSLLFDLGGLVAGFIIVFFYVEIINVKWGLLVYPGILSTRGVIGGIFSGRISSGLHTGSVSPSIKGNTKEFGNLWRALIVLTNQSSICLSVIAGSIGIIIFKLDIIEVISILIVVSATLAIVFIVVTPMNAALSFWTFKKGMDPDVIVYPIMSTISDIIVTLVYVSILMIFYTVYLGSLFIIIPSIILLSSGFWLVRSNSQETSFKETIRESVFTLILVSIIVNITGTVLQSVNDVIGSRPEIYLIYPALLDTIGDVGSIVGSTATTKINLGMITSSLRSIKDHLQETFAAISAGLLMCTFYTLIAGELQGIELQGLFELGAVLYSTAFIATSIISVIAFTIAILTYRRGWDPDNFVIPIESSLADTITSTVLLIILILLVH